MTFPVLLAASLLASASESTPAKPAQSLVELGKAPGIVATAARCAADTQEILVVANGKSATMPDEWGKLPCGIRKSESKNWDFTAGEDENSFDVSAREVSITGASGALVVSVQAGFEHTHWHHALFVATRKGIKRAWDGGDSTGPIYTSVEAIGGVLYFNYTFDYGGPDMADSFRRTEIRWNPKKESAAESPAAAFGVIAATRDSLDAARTAEGELEKACAVNDLLVLATGDFSALAKGKWIVVRPEGTSERAETRKAALATCAPDAYVKSLR